MTMKQIIIEIDEQTQFVIECRMKGEKSKTRLRKVFMEEFKGRGATAKQFEIIYKKVDEFIAEYFSQEIESLFSEITMHLWDLYNKSYKLQDYRECRAILKAITDLTESGKGATAKPVEEVPKQSQLATLMRKVN
jgi:hypothetical protein